MAKGRRRELAATSYDETPYPSLAHEYTHPDRLATAAMLFGMAPAPVGRCRALELGCGDGTNLLGMALSLPGSEFVGVDLSYRHIERGLGAFKRFHCNNVRLVNEDFTRFGERYGEFDYVIAHGVYSWVPPEVRRALLRVCRERLSPQGVALVSYNAYPGWHLLQGARDLMRLHTRHIGDPHRRAQAAREVIARYLEMLPAGSPALVGLTAYREVTRRRDGSIEEVDAALLHDELTVWNEPQYFSDFAAAASQAGLQYLAGADFANLTSGSIDPAISDFAQSKAQDLVDLEQYLDFATNRTFRRTLLCHQGIALQRSLRPNADFIAKFYLSSAAVPAKTVGDSHESWRFEAPDGSAFATDDPLTGAGLLRLSEVYPGRIPFSALRNMAVGDADASRLAANLLGAFAGSRGLAGLHACGPALTVEPSARPRGARLAREQAKSSDVVTNLLHERVRVGEGPRRLLPLLNGRRGVTELSRLATDEFHPTPPVAEEGARRALVWLARAGLLEA